MCGLVTSSTKQRSVSLLKLSDVFTDGNGTKVKWFCEECKEKQSQRAKDKAEIDEAAPNQIDAGSEELQESSTLNPNPPTPLLPDHPPTCPNMEEELGEESEEEIVRCICNSQEYPGLPVTSEVTQPSTYPNSSVLSEDIWFIQCDSCKFWQHGGCVGIMDEATSPDQYFCEQCRKDFHKIMTDINGSAIANPQSACRVPLIVPQAKILFVPN